MAININGRRIKNHGLVGLQPRIGEQTERHPLFFVKALRLLRRSVADRDQLGAGLRDLACGVAQLRDLLLAEQSPEVTQEHENDGRLLPEIAEPDGLAVEVESGQVVEGVGHAPRITK